MFRPFTLANLIAAEKRIDALESELAMTSLSSSRIYLESELEDARNKYAEMCRNYHLMRPNV